MCASSCTARFLYFSDLSLHWLVPATVWHYIAFSDIFDIMQKLVFRGSEFSVFSPALNAFALCTTVLL